MADYTITAADVHIHEGARTVNEKFGETMTAGQSCYYATAAEEWLKLDANTEHNDRVKTGVVIVGADEDGYGIIALEGDIDVGTTLTVGIPVIASTTAGGLAPVTDWTGVPYASAWQYHIGYPVAADKLRLNPHKTGVSVA